MSGVNKLKKRAFRICVGNDDATANLRSVRQRNADGLGVLNENSLDLCAGLQRCAPRAGRRRQRLRDTTHAAFHQSDVFRIAEYRALDIGVTPRAARRRWIAHVVRVNESRSHRFRLEEFGDDIAHARQ